ncbi:hypothetical protein Bca52824_012917 [Brassica carinata]|uniref:Uncharacterized protein n=1 Tax=Brassica carinata TaxID=52824 RepID=A0A8X8B0T6_BRACI|nr:hypothetical protein Bca52824_012917 [Brassica carinata]
MANFSGLQLLFFSFIIATENSINNLIIVYLARWNFRGLRCSVYHSEQLQLHRLAWNPHAPAGWSGRIWGRTGCNFDAFGAGRCFTGDCGNKLQCNGAGGATPATLAEFTIGHGGGMDFYDVSLVDGYNVQMEIKTQGGSGDCQNVGCISDLNRICPNELSVRNGGSVVACKSACAAFDKPEFCCTGQFNQPETCPPTDYSRIFKTACPKAYSYAYDDATSTFTCANANYSIIFCPTI